MPEQFTHRAICELHMRGQVIKDHFVSQVLSSNPLGDPVERDLLVYLPPGYEGSPGLHYPVVFALAGYSESDASLQNRLPFQPTLSDRLDLLTAQGLLGAGIIVVMPDCFTAYGGSQYVNSPAVGNYDDYLGCSHWRWWINRSAITQPILDCFSSSGSPDRTPDLGVRLQSSASDGTLTKLPRDMTLHPIWLKCLSSGNGRQGAREHLPGCPSLVRSPRCQSFRTLPVPLRRQVAPSFSRLHEPHPKPGVGTYKVVIGSPPFQVCQQVWGRLRRRPGATSQRGYSVSDGQIHPLNESRVESTRETESL